MVALKWDQIGSRTYETGVSKGVLYIPNSQGVYNKGYAWSGLTGVTESPSGAESNPQYADNIKYLDLTSAEEFGATVEAFTYPVEFEKCDGTAELTPGVTIGQQNRTPFGLAYRTKLGNDVAGDDWGYKLHLIYGAKAAPSERAYTTVNDSPEALTFSWELTTTPVDVPGYKPTATLVINSTKVAADKLADLEAILYGTAGNDPRLPLPEEVADIIGAGVQLVSPSKPTYDAGTDTITIPSITGVDYFIDDQLVTGAVVITEDTVVTSAPKPGYKFPAVTDTDWLIQFA